MLHSKEQTDTDIHTSLGWFCSSLVKHLPGVLVTHSLSNLLKSLLVLMTAS